MPELGMFEAPKDISMDHPSYEELLAALPDDLQEEFKLISEQISKLYDNKSGLEGHMEDGDMDPNEKIIFDRHEELQKIAMGRMNSSSFNEEDNAENKTEE